MNITLNKQLRKKRKVRAKIFGTAERPRIAVNRSNKYIYAQAIDDTQNVTLAAYSVLNAKKEKDTKKTTKVETAKVIGNKLADILKEKGIKQAVFDRSYYLYKGRVQALCEGLRENGITI